MKYLLLIPIAVLAFAVLIISITLVYTFIGWLNGAENVLMPGLGLVINAAFLLLFLLVAEIILVYVLAIFVGIFRKY